MNIIDNQLSYELVELPFLKEVKQLKYTYANDIVLLGNDQVLYSMPMSGKNINRVYPIFNEEDRIRIMGFDMSIDCKVIAVVSNRTVFTLRFNRGLGYEI